MRDPAERHALALVDLVATDADRQHTLDILEIHAFQPPPPDATTSTAKKNVVVFGLQDRSIHKDVNFTYAGGMFRNADFCQTFYPGWTCRVYFDADVDPEVGGCVYGVASSHLAPCRGPTR
jgi:hypothetical protein